MAINWISSLNESAYITLDSQGRIYLSSDAMKIIGVKRGAPFHLVIGHDPDERRLIIAKPGDVKTDAEPFKFDKRAYCKRAATVLKSANITGEAPIKFHMIGAEEASKQAGLAYPSGTFAFKQR